MSIADDVRATEARPPGGPSSGGAPAHDAPYDRTPPQDIAAEQCVLGGMLLSKDAIADVVEVLKAPDFYRPAHATIFDAILDLYGRGEPADPITVSAALADAGDLARVGGAPYLHTLIASVPTAANAAYYARIVGERAVLRRLVEAGTRIVQLGYGSAAGAGRDVDDVVDLAQQAVYDVTERRVSEDFVRLEDLLQPTLDEIEAVGAQGGVMTGVPTGFTDLDRLLNGLHPGQLVIVAGRPGLGKALALDTPLPTPDGWTTMAQVRVGDTLIGADGEPTAVVATSEVMRDRPCYEVEFSDGSVIVADGSHRWLTHTRRSAGSEEPPRVRTTEEIRATLRTPAEAPGTPTPTPTARRPNHAVTTCRPLSLPDRDLPVPPYAFGAWLGSAPAPTDEPWQFTTDDPEIAVYLKEDGLVAHLAGPRVYAIHPPAAGSWDAGVTSRRIPAVYLRASSAQRRALLAGLLDAGGVISPSGTIRYQCRSRRLADDVHELIVGLGHGCAVTAGTGSTASVVEVCAADDVFRLERKRLLHGERRRALPGALTGCRFIVDVRPVASVPVRCVTVDNDDHLYLAGRSMIPTHNSTAAMDFARSASVKNNLASAIFSLEMSKVEIVMRLLAAESRVPLHVLRSGQLSDDDWTKLARRMGEISEAPLFVDDTPNMNLMEIRAKARRLRQRHDLKLIVVDYLQLMTSPKRVESRQQEVAELSRGLKLLAKEVECPVIAVSQLNRGPEQRNDKRPQLSDLRESGCLTGATRLIRADTNAEVTLGELVRTGERDVPVWALDEGLRYTARTLTHAFPSGRRPVYRLRLASGKQIEATANHPFLTFDGWRPLGELVLGTRMAVPRHVPPPLTVRPLPAPEVVRLARRIGVAAGSVSVPDRVFGLPKSQIALFLRHLWAANGAVTVGSLTPLLSSRRRLLADVSRLLLRFGISARLVAAPRRAAVRQPAYALDVPGPDDRQRLRREIGLPGRSATASRRDCDALAAVPGAKAVPHQVWHRVRDVLADSDTPRPSPSPETPGRQRLRRIAAVLDANDLDLHATNDVLWDEVVAIDPMGERDVFDATVLGVHNFIADGIAVHNSIEQDADVVILLHRDDYYDKESPRAGEADFIVAKHRNGPTDTVTVAAQLHFSRFVDMAIQ